MFNLNYFLYHVARTEYVRERLVCKDGFSISVQAGAYSYSTPRSQSDSSTSV
jgi:hypothetical protein